MGSIDRFQQALGLVSVDEFLRCQGEQAATRDVEFPGQGFDLLKEGFFY